ncbi:MAG: DUF4411 family protein [Elusimicrobia bacterium]|nr:DUF4411 family protein [Candidatus Liberimonas magnetica]
MSYLLDANVFIQAKNLHYEVFSVEKVGDELEAGNDELAEWASKRGPDFFLKPDGAMLPALRTVGEWSAGQRYDPAAVNLFLQDPDYYLVSHALSHQNVVVTQEKPSPSIKKIKIPDVCIGLKIKFMTPFEMLRHERARFILG